jgi:hypothetical protein
MEGVCDEIPWSIATPVGRSKASGSATSQGRVAGCKTVITRAAFENLASAIAAGHPPQANLKFADLYSEQLISAHRAHKLGLDKGPGFAETLKFTDLQLLARTMSNHMKQQAENLPEAEFEKYYKEHSKEFEQVQLLQLTIPKRKGQSSESESSAPPAAVDVAAEEAAMKAEAEKLRREAVAGGDFEKLEVEAYAVANEDDAPLDPAVGKVTRAKLGQFQKLVFDELQPGQVSEVVSSEDYWVIFKVLSKEIMPRDDAKVRLSQQRLKEAWDLLRDSVKPRLNDSYFNKSPIAKDPEPVAAKGGQSDNKRASAPDSVSSVAPEDSVITMEGVCDDIPWSIAKSVGESKGAGSATSGSAISQSKDAGCKTVITRAAFEKLAAAISPGQPPQANLQFAHQYSELLISAHQAHELGLDKGPGFAEIEKFTNLQLLAHTMSNHLQKQAENLPAAEFEKYYTEHSKEFEQVELLQLTIPKRKEQSSESASSVPASTVDPAAEEAVMKAEAEKLRREAVAGGDFKKLEVEAYTVASDPYFAPDPAVSKVTRASARQFQKLMFDELQPGQVSELVTYQDFWLVFKVVSKQIMPRDEAKKFTGPWMKEATDSLKNSVKSEFNDAYFNPRPVAQPTTPGQQ